MRKENYSQEIKSPIYAEHCAENGTDEDDLQIRMQRAVLRADLRAESRAESRAVMYANIYGRKNCADAETCAEILQIPVQ